MANITITMNNAAFEDKAQEVARILKELADTIIKEGDVYCKAVRDVNGNTVGLMTIKGE